LGIKIMMPPDVVEGVAGALIAKQVLREIVRSHVKSAADEHYFVVMMHKGVSRGVQNLTFEDISKLLARPKSSIHRMIADHIVNGSARGGCGVCNGASSELRTLVVEEKIKAHSQGPFSLFMLLSSYSPGRRPAR
jgi:hypothetical protein